MKYLMPLLCGLLLLSCKKSHIQNNEITKVELARSGAWSDYGATISIDTSLNYKYYGDYGNIKQGFFTGKINEQFWDTLNHKFEQIKYKKLPVSDNAHVADANYFELIIHWKTGKRRIQRVWNYPPDSVLSVIKWIDTSFQKVKLHRTKDTFRFEGTYHRPMQRLFDSVRFPPPIKQ